MRLWRVAAPPLTLFVLKAIYQHQWGIDSLQGFTHTPLHTFKSKFGLEFKAKSNLINISGELIPCEDSHTLHFTHFDTFVFKLKLKSNLNLSRINYDGIHFKATLSFSDDQFSELSRVEEFINKWNL